MASRLTDVALNHLKENPKLANEACEHAGINPLYVVQAIMRNSRAFTTYKSVILIADSLNVPPESIIQETKK